MKAIDALAVDDGPVTEITDRHRFLFAPSYDAAYGGLYREVFERRLDKHPVLGGIRRETTEHSGPIRSVDAPRYERPMQTHSGTATLTVESIVALDFNAHAKQISELADRFLAEMERELLDFLSGVANAVGNNFDGQGRPLSLESLREAARKVEWDFDDDGKVIPKSLLYPAQHSAHALEVIKAAAADPEMHRIVNEKRATFLAERPKRRLVRPC
jgi:hypothetical protein